MIEALEAAAQVHVSRETFQQLEVYVALLLHENDRQNLIGRSTVADVWERHILDSAQLLRFAGRGESWLDVGSGAGLPGMVIAVLTQQPTTLAEPRRLRADFLQQCVDTIGLANAHVACAKAERLAGRYDRITARAVAPVAELFRITGHVAHAGTRWILPKGRSGAKELAEAQRAWQGRLRAEPSITDPESVIVVAEGIRPRGGTSK